MPVELHIVSDSTGETAARLVQALEAQFPEQEFEEVRHPRCETVTDLERAVTSARGRASVVVYTLVDPQMRDAMRRLCRRARVMSVCADEYTRTSSGSFASACR